MIEVPSFTRGEPGFTNKLNELADAVRELQDAQSKSATKRAAPKPAAKPESGE